LRCNDWYQDNSPGHGNLYSHINRNHDDWQVLLSAFYYYYITGDWL
jgi:hypothetical protein